MNIHTYVQSIKVVDALRAKLRNSGQWFYFTEILVFRYSEQIILVLVNMMQINFGNLIWLNSPKVFHNLFQINYLFMSMVFALSHLTTLWFHSRITMWMVESLTDIVKLHTFFNEIEYRLMKSYTMQENRETQVPKRLQSWW